MKPQEKRKQLMDAAYRVFAKKGYQNASIKDIASEAGITPGLVHYYFKNKEELLLSVQEEEQREYHRQYEGQSSEEITPESLLMEIKSRAQNNPDWYRWRYEIYSLGLKRSGSDLIAQQAATVLKNGRDSLSEPLRHFAGDSPGIAPLAGILLACFDGLALQKILDDDFDIDRSYQLLLELVELYAAKSSQSD